ncbi:MAG TPA: hypothetical protein VJV79_18295 [Polyangiaceae bacterium]|nr:hypothetical protein [Polyangiaceae bacterium]
MRFVEQGTYERQLSIAMRKDGDFISGELRLTERDGSLRQRNVRFTTCSEAVEGLALIAVVSLDPQALLQPARATEPAPPPTPAPKPPLAQSPAKSDPVPLTPQPKLQWALGAEFNFAPRALPAPALGGSLFVDLDFVRSGGFAPLFRAALSHVERRGLSSGTAEANFTLTLATVSACPLRIQGGFLVLRPCAFVSGGALHAWGSQTTNLQQRTRPYGALGGSVMLLAQVSQALELVADLGLGATLVPDTFGFDDDQPWKTPPVYLSSGIGARFVFR